MFKLDTTPQQFFDKLLLKLKNKHITIENQKIIYSEEFDKDTAVWEKYNLKEHTLLVLNQFFKYDYYDNDFFPKWADMNAFIIMLTLHDIGKPFAIKISSKTNQGEYNKIFVKDIMLKLKIPKPEWYAELVTEDIIGKYIEEEKTFNQTIKSIISHANNCNLKVNKFYQLIKIYYMCDAGSYTINSGGKESLDWMFVFDEKNRKMLFSNNVQSKINKLNKKFKELK